jgi:hypothetical protein
MARSHGHLRALDRHGGGHRLLVVSLISAVGTDIRIENHGAIEDGLRVR